MREITYVFSLNIFDVYRRKNILLYPVKYSWKLVVTSYKQETHGRGQNRMQWLPDVTPRLHINEFMLCFD